MSQSIESYSVKGNNLESSSKDGSNSNENVDADIDKVQLQDINHGFTFLIYFLPLIDYMRKVRFFQR